LMYSGVARTLPAGCFSCSTADAEVRCWSVKGQGNHLRRCVSCLHAFKACWVALASLMSTAEPAGKSFDAEDLTAHAEDLQARRPLYNTMSRSLHNNHQGGLSGGCVLSGLVRRQGLLVLLSLWENQAGSPFCGSHFCASHILVLQGDCNR
jgi:hypothetical protein